MIEPSKMAIENIPPVNADSEREEGEIVDELDELSDISSEEEYFLRQRLIVLENYNNVLERKKAKNSVGAPGDKGKHEVPLLHDLSDISGSEAEGACQKVRMYKNFKVKRITLHPKQKKRRETEILTLDKLKNNKKRTNRKKKMPSKVLNESSEESEDEYRNKRRKLADAVSVNTDKNDTSTLRARLKKMLCGNNIESVNINQHKKCNDIMEIHDYALSHCETDTTQLVDKIQHENKIPDEILMNQAKVSELIDLCKEDDDVKIVVNEVIGKDCVDSPHIENSTVIIKREPESDSDEDLEVLRQHALKTKSTKVKIEQTKSEKQPFISDEDRDTEALRLICLKSALLKKAIEIKQKQKLRKSVSQSFHDEFDLDRVSLANSIEADNNTDVESVDMDIGSDVDEKSKELPVNSHIIIDNTRNDNLIKNEDTNFQNISKSIKDEEIEEDEDLLRAKLLTSLSKNLPNLVDSSVVSSVTEVQTSADKLVTDFKNKTTSIPEQKPLIIELRESDSEGAEDEATKNLTKMHMKLYEQNDFQERLELFLKSTRMEVESKELPDVVQKQAEPAKQASKSVPKAVRNLPKPEQIEYKNLLKRMAELERIKLARQYSMNFVKSSTATKDTLKPRNVTAEVAKNVINNLEEQIATSRKKIAEESSKMLKLKEEASKLSQKYKIAATELRNISTAITLNKKEQKAIQNKLTKIRLQHQLLMKSSTSNNNTHSKINIPIANLGSYKMPPVTKVQKENDPSKEEYKNPFHLKAVKVSVVNDLKEDPNMHSRLSVELDVSNNKKIIKVPKSIAIKERIVNVAKNVSDIAIEENNAGHPVVEKGGGDERTSKQDVDSKHISEITTKDADVYRSPLDALHAETDYVDGQNVYTSYRDAVWVEDPNSFLCPFEVGGTCKDPDCKYIHPKIPSD